MKKIQLTKGQFTLVDDSDFELLNQWNWCAKEKSNTFYAVRRNAETGKIIFMHRFILGLTDSKIQGEHRDHNGLNNKRNNLRVSTQAQNICNKTPKKNGTSKYLGVYYWPQRKKWMAQIAKDGKHKYLGVFVEEMDAALAYNKAALTLHGEYANLNIL